MERSAAPGYYRLYVRVFRKEYTPEEIQTLIDFYRTPAGQKQLLRSQSIMMQVMTEARKIGAYLGPTLAQELLKGNHP